MIAYAPVRLVLNLAAPWIPVAPAAGEELAFVREDIAARLHTTALYDPFSPPDFGSGQVAGERTASSSLGWPVSVRERLLADQRRELAVHYRFFEWGGSVVIRGAEDVIARHRDELIAVALDGVPDFGGEPTCLAELMPAP